MSAHGVFLNSFCLGWRPAPAYPILQAGYQLKISWMWAALALITLAGVVLDGSLSRRALGRWHESEVAPD